MEIEEVLDRVGMSQEEFEQEFKDSHLNELFETGSVICYGFLFQLTIDEHFD